MPGLHKMNCLGICFLKDQFLKNPSISYSELTKRYNEKADKMGWRRLKSSGTVGYHLQKAGLSQIRIRKLYNHGNKKYKIEATIEQRAQLAKTFGTSTRNVIYALNFERNSELALRIRQAALNMGCKQYEIEVTISKKMIDEPVKPIEVLDNKVNVTRVINQ